MEKSRNLVIFGAEDFGDIAYEYFTYDSEYRVVGFTVDRQYLKESTKFGLPVVAFEDVEKTFPPANHSLFAAIVYAQLNRLRENVCTRAKEKGYPLASYFSSRSFIWRNVSFGEHCFVFEDNTIQPFVKIGENVVVWSGNHIGHHSIVGNHCFLTSHVVISGWSEIGDHCFLGVNSTLANNTRVGAGSWVSHSTSLSGDIPPRSLVKAVSSEVSELNEAVLFRSLARSSRARGRNNG